MGSLKQLIPGNPGTSFVVSLMYALKEKYNIEITNDDQLPLFTKGIVSSRNVFFSGVLNVIAEKYGHKISAFSNSQFIINLAKPELDGVTMALNDLKLADVDELLKTHKYVVISVDMFEFRKYHDYHFVCISKMGDSYQAYEPKDGVVKKIDRNEAQKLILSVPDGLKDIVIAFCI